MNFSGPDQQRSVYSGPFGHVAPPQPAPIGKKLRPEPLCEISRLIVLHDREECLEPATAVLALLCEIAVHRAPPMRLPMAPDGGGRDLAQPSSMILLLRALRRRTQGQDLIEYALLAAFLSIAAFALIATVGGSLNGVYSNTQTATAAAGSGPGNAAATPETENPGTGNSGNSDPGNGNSDPGNGNGGNPGNGNGGTGGGRRGGR